MRHVTEVGIMRTHGVCDLGCNSPDELDLVLAVDAASSADPSIIRSSPAQDPHAFEDPDQGRIAIDQEEGLADFILLACVTDRNHKDAESRREIMLS